jgi:hypothetical protein
MKVITLGDDKRFDVDGSLFGVVLQETDLHDSAELSSIKCFNRILTGKTELKAEDKTLKTLFIEYEIDQQGNGNFVPSGLSTTEAGTWRINIRRLVIEIDSQFLQFCYEHKDKFNFLIRPSKENKWIGRGFCLPIWNKDKPEFNILNLHNMWEDYCAGEEFEYCYARYFDEQKYLQLLHKRRLNNK